MSTIKISLKDNDYVVQATTNMKFDDQQDRQFSNFINRIKEELAVGQTETLEIEGLDKPVRFEITELK